VPKVVKKEIEPKKRNLQLFTPIFAIGRYLKGSWSELRLVRWPNRKATWGMTAAVIIYTVFFVALIVFLDWVFNALFKLIIK
jgi:preprotein translocase SecE subunit